MTRLDTYEALPESMRHYLANHGWHFSKKMAEWAISMMRDRKGERVKPKEKEELINLMKSNNVETENMVGYDAVYVEAMARSDFFGSSIATESHIIRYVGDLLNDKDGYDGIAFTRFYADTIGKGIPIDWEEML